VETRYKLAIVNPYYGKLPNLFPYWLKTCSYNPTIDWFVFTDDERAFDGTFDKAKPENVRFVRSSLNQVKARIEKIVHFDIPLYRPYKICDYRPAYGLIFKEYLVGYDFWGYSDLDVLFGNLRKFVTEEKLDRYDRIYTNGYLSFYRNTEEVNNWFRTLSVRTGREVWEEVFSTGQNWEFDEWAGHRGGGITQIIEDNNKPMYMVKDWANIVPRYGQLCYNDHGIDAKNVYFRICKDGAFAYDEKTKKYIEEVSFVHFFKRPLRTLCGWEAEEYYCLAPNILCGRFRRMGIKILAYHLKNKTVFDVRRYIGKKLEPIKKKWSLSR